MKPASFFDDDYGKLQKKIWDPVPGNKTVSNLETVYLCNQFYKRSKKVGKSKQIYYVLTEEGLYQVKKNEVLCGFMDLTCVKMDLLIEVQDAKTIDTSLDSNPNNVHGFRLSRNGKSIEFYTNDNLLYKNWKNVLIYRCIQSTFHEEFIVTKMIGKGSFAKVYLATKKSQNIQYAIKAFNKEFMQNQHKGKESLINEISIMRQLNNDHLIRLYEVYETTNSIYFVVDLLNGGELLHRIREKGSINEKELRVLIRNLILALEHLHQKNIMHRDLKPENLLLKSKQSDSEIVVADFGLATRIDIPNILFKRCGTPGFVAPEVLLYKEGDPFYTTQCDIFSAGIIFYLLLVGKQPFQGKDYKQILRANKACEIRYDLPEFEKISNAAKDLLKKMLDARPEHRFSATQCLQHPFLHLDGEYQPGDISCGNLGSYEVEFLANVRNKQLDSQEMIGSLALHSTGKLPINGNVNTIGSLSTYSNSSITNLERKNTSSGPGASIFNKGRSDSIDQNMTGTPSSRKSNNNSLFKATLIKNSYHTSQFGGNEERKGRDDEYEENCDVGEENSPVCNSVNKMNIEKSMKHNPSKCDESSNSPKSAGTIGTPTNSAKYGKSTIAKK
ncbi:Serine/Threonine kinase domain protein (macronuclear) [Tetrahymena thermophila SB210]|uniref:Serine/Threonine kinase domain protein n=1 Tax=Tetrahymena thermophila (strain SB210) TaxID=312017 RepID=I7M148_TETTS|nr:Serine/Threonine kinase domain protein [Tetrahymena thermophila SB210]EAR94233.1 Serine/Threonine kinase domain protein [Tetrahymena thermophila SB210]|eukprot:XP_001014478.1 Serine/Threonine kinase domain protein [Tetrahymena thermophila SB210]